MKLFVVRLAMMAVAGVVVTAPGHLVHVPQRPCAVIAGYMIRDTAHPELGVFYRSSGDLTQGLFVGYGGTWEIVRKVCAGRYHHGMD